MILFYYESFGEILLRLIMKELCCMSSIYHLFPRTIHPMVIHFTIAFIFLTAFVGVIGIFRRKDVFFAKAFFFMLFISIVATLAAGVAGVISESYLKDIPNSVGGAFETHKNSGEITGVLLVIAFAFQWLKQRKVLGISMIALLISLISVITVSVAGHLGGNAVYDHGLGVLLSH